MANAMVGASTIVFPVYFHDNGLIDGILVSVVLALISIKTS